MTLYERDGDDISRGLVGYWKLDDLKRISADGIVNHYKMNDNAANTIIVDSKSGNNGTASVNTSTMTAVGKINESLNFNGSTESINLNKNLLTYPLNFTISMWIKIAGSQDSNAKFFMAGQGSTGVFGFAIRGSDAGSGTEVKFTMRDVGDTAKTIPFDLGDNDWHHIVVVKDGTALELFVDNVSRGTETLGVSEYRRDVATFLGGSGTANSFGGELDDVRLYDRVLNDSEIAQIWNSGNGTETTELFRKEVVAIDRANFNDGTITGCTNADGQNWNPTSSMFFDGIDDYITLSSTDIGFDIGNDFNYTISAWVRNVGSSTQMAIGFGRTTNNNPILNLGIASGDDAVFQHRDDGDTIANLISGVGEPGFGMNDGKWYLLTAVRHAQDSFSLYVNGVLVDTNSTNIGTTTLDALTIGALERTSFGSFFNGNISGVRIYNRSLTSGEISKLYRLRK